MQRLWVRWAAMAVFAATMITAFVLLGRWQLQRLEGRRDGNEVVRKHEAAPVLPFAEAFTGPVEEHDQWQRVEVTGRYLSDDQLQIRYRSYNDQQGIEVATPLRADDGRTVLVDRGFIAVPTGQPIPDVLPPPPSGPVTVVGFVRRNERGSVGAITPVDRQVRLINAPAAAGALGYPLVDGYLGLQTSRPAQGGDLVPVGPPRLTEGPHLSYALQWFSFTLIAVAGLVVLIRGDLRERRDRGQGRHTVRRRAAAADDE